MKHGLLASFVGGIAFTLILVLFVPLICSHYIEPFIAENVENANIAWLSSSMVTTIIMWIVMLLFMMVLGGGGIFKAFGVVGILGLICGYYLLGRIEDAIIPVGTLVVFLVLSYTHKKKKEKKEAAEASRK